MKDNITKNVTEGASQEELLLGEPPVSAEPLYDILYDSSRGYKIFCVICSATKIGLFDELVTPRRADEICASLGTNATITKGVCEVLADIGIIEREDGFYQNTEMANLYLRADSPLDQSQPLQNLVDGFQLWEKLDHLIEKGPVRADEEQIFGNNLVGSLASEALCRELQRTINIISDIPEFGKARRLLDLGGGHGLYAIAATFLNPDLRAYVYDLPEVVEYAKTYIKRFDAGRVETVTGNLFEDDIGGGYDVVLLFYNPGGKNPWLVPKIHSSLNDGGLFISKHAFYDQGDRSKSSLLDLEWNLTAFQGVKKKENIYSFEGDLFFEDYVELLERHFSITKIVDGQQFAGYPLSKFGDTLDSKIIVAKKK
jgi:hypothetical protein